VVVDGTIKVVEVGEGAGVVVVAATVDVDAIEVEFAESDAESRHLTPFRSNPSLQTDFRVDCQLHSSL